MKSNFLQVFLTFDVFLIGMVAAEAIRHAYIHFRGSAQSETEGRHQQSGMELPPEIKARLLQTSQAHFLATLDHSASQLQRELAATSEHINQLLEHMGNEVVSTELERYQAELTDLRKKAESHINSLQTNLASHEQELRQQLAEDIAAEKKRLIAQIDTKLADAVSSFLIDTLGHNVDLGAQATYITAQLEEHKAELIKGVGSEDPAA